MSSVFMSWMVTTLSLLITAAVLPGMKFNSTGGAVTAAFILGIVNFTLKPILTICTFPITILTFGLFSWVVNGISLYVVSIFTPGFYIYSYLDACLGSFLMYLASRAIYMAIDYGANVDVRNA